MRKSLVLLKNGKSGDAPFLPLRKKASKILVAGSHANDIGYQCGGWTSTWQGSSGNITKGGLVHVTFQGFHIYNVSSIECIHIVSRLMM